MTEVLSMCIVEYVEYVEYVDCGVTKTSDPDTRRTNLYLKVTVQK